MVHKGIMSADVLRMWEAHKDDPKSKTWAEFWENQASFRAFIASSVLDALTYDADEERRILYGDGSREMPTGVLDSRKEE